MCPAVPAMPYRCAWCACSSRHACPDPVGWWCPPPAVGPVFPSYHARLQLWALVELQMKEYEQQHGQIIDANNKKKHQREFVNHMGAMLRELEVERRGT